MYDRIDAIEQLGGKFPNVSEHLAIEERLGQEARPSQALGEIGGVKADQLGIHEIFTKESREDGTNISHIARNQNAHSSPLQIPSSGFPRAGRAAGN